jgi:hypothetical protein
MMLCGKFKLPRQMTYSTDCRTDLHARVPYPQKVIIARVGYFNECLAYPRRETGDSTETRMTGQYGP